MSKVGKPFFALLKLTAWAGAGFAASRALRQRSASKQAPPDPRSEPAGSKPAASTGPPRAVTEPASTPPALESLWIPGANGSLHLLRSSAAQGSGELPMLFLHGLGGTAHQWEEVLSVLPDTVEGVALDLPGHGRSDLDAEQSPMSVADLSTAVSAVADGLGWRQFLLVGHSLGAAVAIHYAGRQPRRTAGLLLVDPNGDQTQIPEADRHAFLSALEDQAHEELRWQDQDLLTGSGSEARSRVLADLEATPEGVLQHTLAAAFAYSPMSDLDRYLQARQGPVRCLLSPMNDLPYSLHRLRPELQVAIIRGAGHWIMLDDPGSMLELLGSFREAALPQVH